MPAKGSKLSSAVRKARAAKARVTRCTNKCALDLPKKSRKSNQTSSKRRATRENRIKQLAPWREFLAAWRVAHPENKTVMKSASLAYAAAKAAGTL